MSDNYYSENNSGFAKEDSFAQSDYRKPEYRRIEGFLEDDIREFVGANADKYLERFYCIARGQKPYNWCSALFAGSWMIYRKMWKQAILLTVILALINSAASMFGLGIQALVSLAMLVFYFAYLGREGNVMYWNFVKEELTREGLANIPAPDYDKRSLLARRGGTSILFIILLYVFNLAFAAVLAVFF